MMAGWLVESLLVRIRGEAGKGDSGEEALTSARLFYSVSHNICVSHLGR